MIEPTGSPEASTPRRLRDLDLIPAGSTVTLKAGETLELLCSTEHLVFLAGPSRWRLDTPNCRRGRRQPLGTFRSVIPEAGRLVRFGDGLALEMTTRNPDQRNVPILLAPRNTALLDPAPQIVWADVPSAIQYKLELRSLGTMETRSVVVEPGEAHCGEANDSWPLTAVCSLPWKSLELSTSPLEGVAYLSVGARLTLGEHWFQENQPARIEWLSASRRLQFLFLLQHLPAREAPLLRAIVDARRSIEFGLHDRARRRLVEALKTRRVTVLEITLGDLYLQVDLPRHAAASYRQASANPSSVETSAEASFGLGRALYALARYEAAREQFARATALFDEAGLSTGRLAAANAVALATERLKER